MNKNEQDMIREIKEKSEQIPVPEALGPRKMEAKCGLLQELADWQQRVWC